MSDSVPQKDPENPLVSVGIPTYNRPDGLRRTLECITGQTFKNLEIIVSDNCSPGEETERVVREFMANDNRIQYYRQDVNRGSAFNFLFVLGRAKGEFFMWAADDDEWDPSFIFSLLSSFIEDLEVVVSMCSVKRVDDFYNTLDIVRFPHILEKNYNQFQLAWFASSHDSITFFLYGLYRTEGIRKFSKNLDNSFGKDMIIICELILSRKIAYLDEVLHIRHIHPKGTAEMYPGEEIGKNYGDHLNYLKLWFAFGSHLFVSSNIPLRRKFWIPLLVMKMGFWVGLFYIKKVFRVVRKKNL
jgi:glycosyltransferase involved in cell wall biosynthesis